MSTALRSPEVNDEELSEGQIESLLHEAEARLRSASRVEGDSIATSHVAFLAFIITPLTSRRLPKIRSDLSKELYIRDQNGIAHADSARLVDDEQRKLSNVIRKPEPYTSKRKLEKPTAGHEWYDLPQTTVTPQFKRDMQLLQMRSVLDPHRHYKKSGKMKIPSFSQVGTVIEGPTEFYSARINKKDRKRNFVDEVMTGEQNNQRFKRKYDEIQTAKRSGKKGHYKALLARRKKRT
ncbi:MAG: hypothetical protein Q9160_002357 [Pyrenula sp. 1 TL-2023]